MRRCHRSATAGDAARAVSATRVIGTRAARLSSTSAARPTKPVSTIVSRYWLSKIGSAEGTSPCRVRGWAPEDVRDRDRTRHARPRSGRVHAREQAENRTHHPWDGQEHERRHQRWRRVSAVAGRVITGSSPRTPTTRPMRAERDESAIANAPAIVGNQAANACIPLRFVPRPILHDHQRHQHPEDRAELDGVDRGAHRPVSPRAP